MPDQEKISVEQFAKNIKSKYPSYSDIDDHELVKKIIDKYPVYKETVDFEIGKKKEPTHYDPYTEGLFSGGGVGEVDKYKDELSKRISESSKSIKKQEDHRFLDIGTPTTQEHKQTKIEEILRFKDESPRMVKLGKSTPEPDIEKAIYNTAQKIIKERRGAYDQTLPKPTKEEISKEIDRVTTSYKNGDYVPSLNEKGESVMKRGTGLFESFAKAVNDEHQRTLENGILSEMPKEDAIKYLNTERQLPKKEDETAPKGVLGKIGNFLGENIPMIFKGTVGAIAGTVAAPETGGASFGTFLSTVGDMAKGGYSETLKKNYNLLKDQHPNMSDYEAFDKAKGAALVGEVVGIGQAALLSKSLPIETPKPTVNVDGVLNGITKSATHAIATAPKVVGGAVLGTVLNDITSNAIGAKVGAGEMEQNALNTAKSMAVMHFGLWAMTEPTNIPSYIRPQVENVIASAPRQEVTNFYKELENRGTIPTGTTEKVLNKLSDFDKQKNLLQKMPLSEEQKAAMVGKLIQRNKLVEENKTLKNYGSSFEGRINENESKISKLDKETNGIAKTGDVFAHETDNLTGDRLSEKTEPVILRHGQTEPNLEGIDEQSETEKLNQTGKEEAKAKGIELKDKGITEIITSPATRSTETAEIMSKEMGENVKVTPMEELREQQPKETDKEFAKRVASVKDKISELGNDKTVVTHNSVLRMMRALDRSNGDIDKATELYSKSTKKYENLGEYKKEEDISEKKETTPIPKVGDKLPDGREITHIDENKGLVNVTETKPDGNKVSQTIPLKEVQNILQEPIKTEQYATQESQKQEQGILQQGGEGEYPRTSPLREEETTTQTNSGDSFKRGKGELETIQETPEGTPIEKKELNEKTRVNYEKLNLKWNDVAKETVNNLSSSAKENGTSFETEVKNRVDVFSKYASEGTFAPTPEQITVLGIRRTHIDNKIKELSSSFDVSDVNNAQFVSLLEELEQVDNVLRRAQQTTGASLNMFKGVFSMSELDLQIKRKKVSIDAGVKIPLTQEEFNNLSESERNKVRPYFEKLMEYKEGMEKLTADSEKEINKYKTQSFNNDIDEAYKKGLEEGKKSKETGKKMPKSEREKMANSLLSLADKIEGAFKANLPEGTQQAGIGIDIQKKIADAIRFIADKIKEGELDIPDIIAKAINKFGEKSEEFEKGLNETLKQSGISEDMITGKTSKQKVVDEIKKQAEEEKTDNLTKEMAAKGLVRKLSIAIKSETELSNEGVLNETLNTLKEIFPNSELTRTDVLDGYLKTGDYTPETKDKIQSEKQSLTKELDEFAKSKKRIKELEDKISELENGKLWDKKETIEKVNSLESDVKKENDKLNDLLNKKGIRLERGDKGTTQRKQTIVDNHNSRIDGLIIGVPDELKPEFEKLKIPSDVENINDKIDKTLILFDGNKIKKGLIKKLQERYKSDKTDANKKLLDDANSLKDKLLKDRERTDKQLQLERLEKTLERQIKEAERKLASGIYTDKKNIHDVELNQKMSKLFLQKQVLEGKLYSESEKQKEANKSKWEKIGETITDTRRFSVISGFYGAERVGLSSIFKSVTDPAIQGTIGRVVNQLPGLKGQTKSYGSSTKAILEGYKATLSKMSVKELEEKTTKDTERLKKSMEDYNKGLDILEELSNEHGVNSKEYTEYRDKELNKLKNEYDKARMDNATNFAYDFISPNAWGQRWKILKNNASDIEEKMGAFKQTSISEQGNLYKRALYAAEIITRSHSAAKDLSARRAMMQGFTERVIRGIDRGEHVEDASVLTAYLMESCKVDYLQGKYMDRNLIAEKVKDTQKWLEQLPAGWGKVGNVFSFTSKLAIPVLKVPLNIAKVKAEYMAGLPIGMTKYAIEFTKALRGSEENINSVKDAFEVVSKHFEENVSQKDKDQIARLISRGAVGGAIFAWSVVQYHNGNIKFGGTYDPDMSKHHKKKMGSDGKPLSYGEFEFFGHRSGKFASSLFRHLPEFGVAASAIEYLDAFKEERGKGEEVGSAAGTATKEVLKTYILESPLQNLTTFKVSNLVTLALTKDIASLFDKDENGNLIERKPTNLEEEMYKGVGFNWLVPTKQEGEIKIKEDKARKKEEGYKYKQENK